MHFPRQGATNTSVCGLSNNPDNFVWAKKNVTCQKCIQGMNSNGTAVKNTTKKTTAKKSTAKKTTAKKTTAKKTNHPTAAKRERERLQNLVEKDAAEQPAVGTPDPVELSVSVEQARIINQLIDAGEDLMAELMGHMLRENLSPQQALETYPVLQGRLIQARTTLMNVAPLAQGSSLFNLPL